MQEASDDLDAGSFGLYELIWNLNSSDFELTPNEKLSVAKRVARRLASRGNVNLYLMKWPNNEPVGNALSADTLDDDKSWDFDADGYYVAISDQS